MSLEYLLTRTEVYIRKRIIEMEDPNLFVFEVTDVQDFAFIRLFQDSLPAGNLWRKTTLYIGKDVEGTTIMKFVWNDSIIPYRRVLELLAALHFSRSFKKVSRIPHNPFLFVW